MLVGYDISRYILITASTTISTDMVKIAAAGTGPNTGIKASFSTDNASTIRVDSGGIWAR